MCIRDRNHLHFGVGTRNHMDGYKLAHTACRRCSRIGGCLYRSHIAADHYRHKTASHM